MALLDVVELRAQDLRHLAGEPHQVVVAGAFPVPAGGLRELLDQLEVLLHPLHHPRPANLDHDCLPAGQAPEVGLADGGGRQGFGRQLREQLLWRPAQLLLDDGADPLPGLGRHLVLQVRQLRLVFGRQQVGSRGQDLAELDEGGSQPLEGQPKVLRPGVRLLTLGVAHKPAVERHKPLQPEDSHQEAEAVAGQHLRDLAVPTPPRALGVLSFRP